MLSKEDNELVCRTDSGTAMGTLFRRYWHPFLLSQELPDPDGAPVKVGLLGEKLVAFRDSDGRVGLVQENCPHRGASLYFALNQDCGITCIYHGFKFNVEGKCVDAPSDTPDSDFKDRVRMRAYPVAESAGILWTYMGPREKQPPAPNFIFNRLPPDQVVASRVPIYCNWLQSVEGNIDSTHLGTLHTYYQDRTPVDVETDKPGYPSPRYSLYIRANAVPIDDYNCMRFAIQYNQDRAFSADERTAIQARSMVMDPYNPALRLKRADNDYMLDRAAQRTKHFAGIWPIPEQDYAMTESMGPIYDRTQEQLYHADAAIIRLRQQLITAARNLERGIEPPGLDPSFEFDRIRSEEIIIGPNDDPWLVAADAGENAGRGERLLVPVS